MNRRDCADAQKVPVPDRVRNLLSRMNLNEKVAQLQSRSLPSIGLKMPSCFERHLLKKVIKSSLLLDGLGTFTFVDEILGFNPGDAQYGAIRRNRCSSKLIVSNDE